MPRRILTGLFFLIWASTASVLGQAPDSMAFQGFLTDDVGDPLDSTGVEIKFALYKGAVEVWSENQNPRCQLGCISMHTWGQ